MIASRAPRGWSQIYAFIVAPGVSDCARKAREITRTKIRLLDHVTCSSTFGKRSMANSSFVAVN